MNRSVYWYLVGASFVFLAPWTVQASLCSPRILDRDVLATDSVLQVVAVAGDDCPVVSSTLDSFYYEYSLVPFGGSFDDVPVLDTHHNEVTFVPVLIPGFVPGSKMKVVPVHSKVVRGKKVLVKGEPTVFLSPIRVSDLASAYTPEVAGKQVERSIAKDMSNANSMRVLSGQSSVSVDAVAINAQSVTAAARTSATYSHTRLAMLTDTSSMSSKKEEDGVGGASGAELDGTGVTDQSTTTGLPLVRISTALIRGMKGSQVYSLQKILSAKGYSVAVTGYFGQDTERAVSQFQRDNNLEVIGGVGPKSRVILNQYLSEQFLAAHLR